MAIGTSAALAIAAVSAAVGTGVSVYGQMEQAKTARRVAEYNAEVEKNRALQEDMESRENARRMRIRNRHELAKQRATIAKAGFIEQGSPLAVLAEQAGLMEMGILDERRASRIRQSGAYARARMGIWEGRQRAAALRIGAGATLASGVGQVAGYYA